MPKAKDEKGYFLNFFNENMTIIKLKFQNVVIISLGKNPKGQVFSWPTECLGTFN